MSSHSFQGSGVQVRLSGVLCLQARQAAVTESASHPEASVGKKPFPSSFRLLAEFLSVRPRAQVPELLAARASPAWPVGSLVKPTRRVSSQRESSPRSRALHPMKPGPPSSPTFQLTQNQLVWDLDYI